MHKRPAVRVAASAVSLLLALTACATSTVPSSGTLSDVKTVIHFDRPAGQEAESITVEPDGSADLGFIASRQLAHVTLDGQMNILATMPLPADGGINTPASKTASVTGIQRTADGTIYFLYSAGNAHLTGLWKLPLKGTPERIAAFPAASFLNGLDRDEQTGTFYITDSTLGRVWQVGAHGGTARIWAAGEELTPTTFFGANGVKVHAGAVWVSNLDRGTMIRIPMTKQGNAGPYEVVGWGLESVDDFAFTGDGNQMLVALNVPSEVVRLTPGEPDLVVLTKSDGLQDATALAINGDTVYVTSSALTTAGDANLLTAQLSGQGGK